MAPGALAILTSGGDAPGMNAAVRAATMIASAQGWQVFGVTRGYKGLVAGDLRELCPDDVRETLRAGGTMLGSSRCPEFHEVKARDEARKVLAARKIGAVLVIGGNGSLTGARLLADPDEGGDLAVNVVGVPASIDNDIGLTGMAIGVDTALNTIVDACDKIADTATAHNRAFIIEVMGRDCGYLAMTAGVACGADIVLFPEAEKSDDQVVEQVVDAIRTTVARGPTRRVICLKAEGVPITANELKRQVDEKLRLAPRIDHLVETRVTVLGHVVRGGSPTAFDRLLGGRLANVAVQALMSGKSSKMAAWLGPFCDTVSPNTVSPLDPYCHLVELDDVLEETGRLISGGSPLRLWRTQAFREMERVFSL